MLSSSKRVSKRDRRSLADRCRVSRIARMLSSTESFRKIDGSCERYPIPCRARLYIGIPVMSTPSITILPACGSISPTIM